MPLHDLATFFDPTLDLPIRGTIYTVQPPDYATGLRLEAIAALTQGKATAADRARLRLDDNAELDVFRSSLGTAFDRMLADGLPWPLIRQAGLTAFVWITQDKCKGTATAEQQWAKSGEVPGEAPAPSTGAEKAARTTRSTSGGAGSGTPKAAHGSGTRSRSKPKAPGGSTSSAAGH